MDYRIELVRRPGDEVLHVEASTSLSGLGSAVGTAIQQLLAQATGSGLRSAGPPEVSYLNEVTSTPLRIAVELPVTGRVMDAKGVYHRAGCQLARTIHRGPYEQIGEAHRAVADWAASNGYHVSGPPTEVYLAGPEAGREPQEYLTEILLPVAA